MVADNVKQQHEPEARVTPEDVLPPELLELLLESEEDDSESDDEELSEPDELESL